MRARSAEPVVCTDKVPPLFLEDTSGPGSIPADCFFDTGLLPALRSDINVAEVVSRLREANIIDSGGRWFRPTDWNLTTAKHEHKAFALLPRIVTSIIEASDVDPSEAKIIFEINSRGVSRAGERDEGSKPDCIGRLASPGVLSEYDDRQWFDIAVPGESQTASVPNYYRKECVKIVQSMTHIMREDVRRRFVLGFTVEGRHMRLWFASRSDVLVSWPFNICENPERLVEYFLRIVFAEPRQLGWDESITRVVPSMVSMPPQYDVDLNGKKYRTIQMLSNIGAQKLRGKGTRVWKVKQLSDSGDEVGPVLVLKDSWVDADRGREGDILKAIIADAETEDEDYVDILNYCLLETCDYGDIQVDGQPDDTFRLRRAWKDLSQLKPTLSVPADPSAHKRFASESSPVGASAQPRPKTQDHIRYNAKVHHRTVFTDVGVRITSVGSLAEVFRCLMDVMFGLQALHLCRWVHGDISTGNILVVNGTGKLADVEYAESETSSLSMHGIRMGTRPFMPPEVACGEYLYLKDDPRSVAVDPKNVLKGKMIEELRQHRLARKGPQERLPAPVSTSRPTQHSQGAGQQAAKSPAQPNSAPRDQIAFRNNPLHDLESLLWVTYWEAICSNFIKNDSKMTEDQWNEYLEEHGRLAADLFYNSDFRRSVMSLNSAFLLSLTQKLLPKVQKILQMLDPIRIILITRYTECEKKMFKSGIQLDFSVADGLHEEIRKAFERIIQNLEADDLQIHVHEELDHIPVKLIKKALNGQKTSKNAGSKAGTTRVRTSTEAWGEVSTRPAKSQKTNAKRFAGYSITPNLGSVDGRLAGSSFKP